MFFFIKTTKLLIFLRSCIKGLHKPDNDFKRYALLILNLITLDDSLKKNKKKLIYSVAVNFIVSVIIITLL